MTNSERSLILCLKARLRWRKSTADPSFLKRVYFIDECSIWIDSTISKGVKVYTDAHDKGFHHVIHCDKLHSNKKIKVRFIAVVNAVHGTVYLEFTTGTKDIQRLHNLVPLDPQHGPYKVIICIQSLLLNHYVAMLPRQNPKPW